MGAGAPPATLVLTSSRDTPSQGQQKWAWSISLISTLHEYLEPSISCSNVCSYSTVKILKTLVIFCVIWMLILALFNYWFIFDMTLMVSHVIGPLYFNAIASLPWVTASLNSL